MTILVVLILSDLLMRLDLMCSSIEKMELAKLLRSLAFAQSLRLCESSQQSILFFSQFIKSRFSVSLQCLHRSCLIYYDFWFS